MKIYQNLKAETLLSLNKPHVSFSRAQRIYLNVAEQIETGIIIHAVPLKVKNTYLDKERTNYRCSQHKEHDIY